MAYPAELTNTYEIYEAIGAGGGGTVYRAVHKRLQKVVVLKKISDSVSGMMNCRTEVDILKNLRHSYLPQVLDFIESSEGIFTVMDYVSGKSLQKMLDEGHRFTEKEVLKYTKQLCEALQYLHSQNPPIIHGDIKPDNVMITPEGNVCLIDFNISGVLENKSAVTYGYTPGFSAPEQVEAFEALSLSLSQEKAFEGQLESVVEVKKQTVINEEKTRFLFGNNEKTVPLFQRGLDDGKKEAVAESKKELTGIRITQRSDIYSLGATVYTLLTGELRDYKEKKLVIDNVSNGFLVVLAKALEYSPEKRYSDVGKMLQAVIFVHKKDKKYRYLLVRQTMAMILLLGLAGASVLCIAKGKQMLAQEKVDRYVELVTILQESVRQGADESEFEEIYREAVALFPEYLDSYYVKANYLYRMKGYEVAALYIEEVLELPIVDNSEEYANLYYLYADCYFQREEYETAEFYYKKSIELNSYNAGVYRDYAITLAYMGREEKADEILERAASVGMSQVDILMVQGELARIAGRSEEALDYFNEVLQQTKDDYLKQRAYIMLSKTYEVIGTSEALLSDVDSLSKASRELELGSRVLIFERLVQDYILLGELEKDKSYYEKAIEVLDAITEMNWGNYVTYSNAIVLCQRVGDLNKASVWAQEMLRKYPEHYMTYLRLCYLEIEKQAEKENLLRSYGRFAEYYEKAKNYYSKQVSGNVTNAEMLRLEQAYQEIKDGGWFD